MAHHPVVASINTSSSVVSCRLRRETYHTVATMRITCDQSVPYSVLILVLRPNWAETVAELKQLGADVVTTEERAKEDISKRGLGRGG